MARTRFLPNRADPPPTEWRRASHFGGLADLFWKAVDTFVPDALPLEEPPLPFSEAALDDANMVNPVSVLRFRVERCDFPHSYIYYRTHSGPSTGWSLWVDDIIANCGFEQQLRDVRLYNAVSISRVLSVRKVQTNTDMVVSRWSRDAHTFSLAWGEITLTFKDVAVLLRLSTRGDHPFDPASLTPAKEVSVAALQGAFREARKYGSWSDLKTGELLQERPKRDQTTYLSG